MKRITLILCLIQLLASIVAFGTCSTNVMPSHASSCDQDTVSSHYMAYLDQEGNSSAYIYCLATCSFNMTNCTFTTPTAQGCTSSGSYSNVWIQSYVVGTTNQCTLGSYETIVNYYSFSTSGSPKQQGETQKYIADGNNCGAKP